ncbi:MAG TPA: hypothetical protein VGF45_07665, partial [Polyangia bacterium]
APVRVGTLDALTTLARGDGGGAALLANAARWLDDPDREVRFGTAAVVVDVLADARVFATLRDVAPLLGYLDRVVDLIATAPRSAERSDGRRRLLLGLPGVLTLVAKHPLGDARAWFEATCAAANHPDVRKVLSDTVVKVGTGAQASSRAEGLRKTLEESAKPLRDPTRLRVGLGRGKASRRTR